MKVVTPAQMNRIEDIAINQFGIPAIILMENAANRVTKEVEEILGILEDKEVFLFAGKGNNGGDAFACARQLFIKGSRVRVCIASDPKNITGNAKINLNILEKLGLEILYLLEKEQIVLIKEMLVKCDVVVDGIFGTGFKGSLTGVIEDLVEALNSSKKPIVAIDIPSGVNGETGSICGLCIRAFSTVTFGLPKIGLLTHPGCEYAGKVVVGDIGIPQKAIDDIDIKTRIITEKLSGDLLPKRSSNSNKGDFGKVFIVSGSKGMTGAGTLAALAALRSGAGLVYLGVPEKLAQVYETALMEAVTVPLPDNAGAALSRDGIEVILDKCSKSTVTAIGPGLSVNEEIVEIISEIIKNSAKPLILDADALNALSKDVGMLKNLKSELVITPHPGEMARILGISVQEVQNNRIQIAKDFAKKWKAITVLKGAKTIVALPDGNVYINVNGNSGMATAGTGDALTGLIAGLAGQGAKLSDAAVVAVFLHGLSGDIAASKLGEHGMIARDLVSEIPMAIKSINRRAL